MTWVLVVVVLALVIGIGAVLEALLWALLICLAIIAVAACLGWRKLRSIKRSL